MAFSIWHWLILLLPIILGIIVIAIVLGRQRRR